MIQGGQTRCHVDTFAATCPDNSPIQSSYSRNIPHPTPVCRRQGASNSSDFGLASSINGEDQPYAALTAAE